MAPAAADDRDLKAPFRILYNNDTTNITSCISPYHKKSEPFRPKMLEASVDEVKGQVDAHFLQPGLGMVPMWPSKVLPLDQHYAWLKERYGQEPDSFGRYVLNGGDVVKVFVDRCRSVGQAPFISFRLNDAHHKEFANAARGEKVGSLGMSVTRSYVEHPEWRVGSNPKRGADLVQNWAIPEVREAKLALIRELCENYDLEGLELDYLRFYSFFPEDKVPVEERRRIMTGFVKQVREVLDRTTRSGQAKRWLCARIPCYLKGFDPLGIDLKAMTEAGLDMVNVSASYFTVQQTDIPEIRKLVPHTAVYVELCHSIWNGEKLGSGYDSFNFRRTTKEQLETTAYLAYANGADGVSLFNFAYYREHGGPNRGVFSEPPFEALEKLRNMDLLSRQPHHWFLAPGWNNPFVRPPLLPHVIKAGTSALFRGDIKPSFPLAKRRIGRLRIQLDQAAPAVAHWTVALNQTDLRSIGDVSEPFRNPYPSMLGTPENMLAWEVTSDLLNNGDNILEIALKKEAGDATINYLDLSFV